MGNRSKKVEKRKKRRLEIKSKNKRKNTINKIAIPPTITGEKPIPEAKFNAAAFNNRKPTAPKATPKVGFDKNIWATKKAP